MAGVQEPATDTPLSEKREKYIVAALDFGTTYSGYAYSFKHDFKKDPTLHIVTNKWECGSLLSHKAPTSVLFDEEAHFHSFGYEAEEKYMELAEDEDVEGWFYFQRFKMKLQGQKVNI